MPSSRSVVNRLVDEGSSLESLNATGRWIIESQSSDHEVFFQNSEFSSAAGKKQIKVSSVSAADDFSFKYEELVLQTYDDSRYMEFVFFARIDGGGTITVTMADTGSASANSETSTFVVKPVVDSPTAVGLANPSWSAYRCSPVLVSKGILPAPRLTVTVSFSPTLPNSDIYFAGPAVYGYTDHLRYSEAIRQTVPYLPVHLVEGDSNSTPEGALIRFLDVMLSGMDLALKSMLKYRFLTLEELRDESDPERLSELVWPSNAGLDEAKWLVQFTGSEPIAKLSSTLDPSEPFVLGSPSDADDYLDAGSGGSSLNGDDTLRFSTTGVNDPPLGTVEVTRDFLRWQAGYGYYGINAGTIKAVTESVKRVMTAPYSVTVENQYDGPFTVKIKTPWEQTYGANEANVGESSLVVKEAISHSKPIGVKIKHELI